MSDVIVNHGSVSDANPSAPPPPSKGGSKQSGGVSALLYIAEAMRSRLSSSKTCQLESKDDKEKQVIEQLLQNIGDMDNKKALLQQLIKELQASGSSVLLTNWVQNFVAKINKIEADVKKAIKKYEDALKKLKDDQDLGKKAREAAQACADEAKKALENAGAAQGHADHYWSLVKKNWYNPVKVAEYTAIAVGYEAAAAADMIAYAADKVAEGVCNAAAAVANSDVIKDLAGVGSAKDELKKKKAALEKKIATLEAKKNPTPQDLLMLMQYGNELLKINETLKENTWFSKATKWLGDQSKKLEKSAGLDTSGGAGWLTFISLGGLLDGLDKMAQGITSIGTLLTSDGFADRNLVTDKNNINTFNGAWKAIQTDGNALIKNTEMEDENVINVALQLGTKAQNDLKNAMDQLGSMSQIFGHIVASAV